MTERRQLLEELGGLLGFAVFDVIYRAGSPGSTRRATPCPKCCRRRHAAVCPMFRAPIPAEWWLAVAASPFGPQVGAVEPRQVTVRPATLRSPRGLDGWCQRHGRDPGLPALTREDARRAARLMHQIIEAEPAHTTGGHP